MWLQNRFSPTSAVSSLLHFDMMLSMSLFSDADFSDTEVFWTMSCLFREI